MKMTTYKMDLTAGLNKLTKIVGGKNNSVPILEYVKITAKNGIVTLTGTNVDFIGIVTLDNAEIEEEGGLLIYFKNLNSFIKKTKSDKITIEKVFETGKEEIKVISNKVNYKVESMDVSNFLKMPNLEYKEITLTNEEFKKAIENTGYSISTTDTRPVLTAINVKTMYNGLQFVSTDSHRLGQYKLNKDHEFTDLEVNPMGTGLILASKLLDKKNKSDVKMKFSGMYTVLEFDNMELYVRNIEGNYPNTERLIPESFNTNLELNTDELLELLPQLTVFSQNENNSAIVLNYTSEGIKLSSESVEVGKISSDLEYKNNTGDYLKISFNSKFFHDVLKTIESKTIKIQFNGKVKPFIIEGVGQGEKHLILPVRTY